MKLVETGLPGDIEKDDRGAVDETASSDRAVEGVANWRACSASGHAARLNRQRICWLRASAAQDKAPTATPGKSFICRRLRTLRRRLIDLQDLVRADIGELLQDAAGPADFDGWALASEPRPKWTRLSLEER